MEKKNRKRRRRRRREEGEERHQVLREHGLLAEVEEQLPAVEVVHHEVHLPCTPPVNVGVE
jgi:hypothetical protein